MNWYRRHKTASVTFYPAGTQKIAQPMTLMDIAADMIRFGYYRNGMLNGTGVKLDDISPDGDSYFTGLTGVINVYMPILQSVEKDGHYVEQAIPENQQLTPEKVKALVDAYNEDMAGEIVLRVKKFEQSKLMGVPVARVEVVQNDTADREEIPEINMANDNARVLLQLLSQGGLPINPEEWSGEFSVEDYLAARNLITDGMKTDNQRDAYHSGDEGGPQFTSYGLDAKQIEMYLRILDSIATWIQQNRLPEQAIVYT